MTFSFFDSILFFADNRRVRVMNEKLNNAIKEFWDRDGYFYFIFITLPGTGAVLLFVENAFTAVLILIILWGPQLNKLIQKIHPRL